MKVSIPATGLWARCLLALPKEMVPIVDKPIIQFIVIRVIFQIAY